MELILNTFGVSLNRDNEAFVITKKGERHRIPVEDVKSIQISRGAQITSDAVMLAVEHEIDVMFMDKGGHPIARVWSPRYGSISIIRKGQLNFTASHAALEWIKEVIKQKMENQLKSDMIEVQSLYENHDSIIVCPVSSDILRSMKIIGQDINLDVITQKKNILFF